jgi:hypothetical protein
MRSKIVQVASILALLLLFFGCGDGSLVEYVDESQAYTSLSLKNRNFVVYIKDQTLNFEDANNDMWQTGFDVDSVVLQPLDSSLNVIFDKENLKCMPISEQCVLPKANYRTPYVKLNAYGNLKMEYYGTIEREKRLLYMNSVKGILPFFVDIGKDTSYEIKMMDVFVMGRLLHNLNDDGFPFDVSKLIAKKDADRILDNKIKAFRYLMTVAQTENVLDSLNFLLDNYDSLALHNLSRFFTELADSVFEKYGMDCRNLGYLCKNAFELGACSSSYYLDTIKNEWSVFKGRAVVCDSDIWRFYDSAKDSMGVCTNYNMSDQYTADSINYFVCHESEWKNATRDLLDKVSAHCSQGETKTIFFAGNYYYCNGSYPWNGASALDHDIGICGIQVPYRTAYAYNDTVAICRYSVSDYDETANGIRLYQNSAKLFKPPTWHWANATEAYLFRHAGNCNVKSDTVQTFLYNDTLFGCTFDSYRRYGWSKLSE